MYIHSIPQKKIEGYLRSECYFSILVLFRGYFDTHTHCYLQREAEFVSKMEQLHRIYLHMSRFPTISNCSTTFWELLYHTVDGQHPAPVNMVLQGKSMGRFGMLFSIICPFVLKK